MNHINNNHYADLEIEDIIHQICYIQEDRTNKIEDVIKKICHIQEPTPFEKDEYIPIANLIKPFYKEMCECIKMINSKDYKLRTTKNILGLEIKKERKNKGLMYKTAYLPFYHNKIKKCHRKDEAVKEMELILGKPYDSKIEELTTKHTELRNETKRLQIMRRSLYGEDYDKVDKEI